LATPPWREHVPVWCLLCEYDPSLHCAVAPVGSLRTLAPDPFVVVVVAVVLDADRRAEGGSTVVGAAAVVVEPAGGRAAGVGLCAASAEEVLLVAVPAVATPPCREHAPRP
jgi:hypothetical protein